MNRRWEWTQATSKIFFEIVWLRSARTEIHQRLPIWLAPVGTKDTVPQQNFHIYIYIYIICRQIQISYQHHKQVPKITAPLILYCFRFQTRYNKFSKKTERKDTQADDVSINSRQWIKNCLFHLHGTKIALSGLIIIKKMTVEKKTNLLHLYLFSPSKTSVAVNRKSASWSVRTSPGIPTVRSSIRSFRTELLWQFIHFICITDSSH